MSWTCLSQLEKSVLRLTNKRENNPSTENAIKLVATDNKKNCLLEFILENVELMVLDMNDFIFFKIEAASHDQEISVGTSWRVIFPRYE